MNDVTAGSVIFAYGTFFATVAITGYFFYRSIRDGYWGRHSEDPKFHLFDAQLEGEHDGRRQ